MFFLQNPCLDQVSEEFQFYKMSLEEFPPPLFFGRIWVLIPFWIFCRIHLWNHLVLEFCFLEVFNYWFNLLTNNLFRFSISSGFSLSKLYVSGSLSITLRLSNFLYIIVQSSFLWSLAFLWYHSFIFYMSSVSPSLSLLVFGGGGNLGKGLSILFSENQFLVSLVYSIILLVPLHFSLL